ncbi:hypothetical protein PRZ48_009279 [Zasmidium cellare]|uniref:Phenol 2-monooxygenase n=1 Tax=Zasmidium cellare TaxID=395010 RepID=A0ABR0EBA4_ZASCE|nr:hypothetical protein PRZ48_009279 [Zasmidium cellare]
MPTFIDHSSHERDSRSNRIRAPPLPRRAQLEENHFDVVVVGAGPAGLLLTLLLSRYGLEDSRLLCLDSKSGSVRAGQADGLQPRTVEVLQSLGLADEIVREACQMWEVAFWNPDKSGSGIERTSVVQDIGAPARYAQEFTIHQGRIERILKEDLARYSERGVRYNSVVEEVRIDALANSTHPVEITFLDTSTNVREIVRAKHIVGCDGARSVVRKQLGLELRGDARDHIWGVIDLVADTDFPDIRRRSASHSKAGSVMVIPRERLNSGDYLTRLYIQMDEAEPAGDVFASSEAELDAREQARQKRARISSTSLLERAREIFAPYSIEVKSGTDIDWWAAYQIGQRLADTFSVQDDQGISRAFIAGDACHTHSPKAGQGMNVSMMDSYNLAWKLAYHLNGLTANAPSLLESYGHERRKIASELIDFDTRFSSVFSQAMGGKNGSTPALTHQEFEDVFTKINEFTTGCGIEYPCGQSVWKDHELGVVEGDAYLQGILRPGRRLLDVRVLRHADSAPWHLQDGLPWRSLPPVIKARAEMRFHSARPNETPAGQLQNFRHALAAEDAYAIYGVDPCKGAIVAIRPDGYVGVVAALGDVSRIQRYFDHILVKCDSLDI